MLLYLNDHYTHTHTLPVPTLTPLAFHPVGPGDQTCDPFLPIVTKPTGALKNGPRKNRLNYWATGFHRINQATSHETLAEEVDWLRENQLNFGELLTEN